MSEIFYKSQTIIFETIICCKCNIHFAVPQSHKSHLMASGDSFYCPNGHSQCYGRTDKDRLREKEEMIQKLKGQLSDSDTVKQMLRDNLNKTTFKLNKARTKINRIKNGVCPCCDRFFENLSDHMESKHPKFSGRSRKNQNQLHKKINQKKK